MPFDLSKFRKKSKDDKGEKTMKKDKKKGINTSPSKKFMERFQASK